AAGGEGAPLAPAFHAAAFARAGVNRAIVNIGGIANVTLLEGRELRMGFDTGPGNTLLDGWVRRHRQQAYDADGLWAGEGVVDGDLLQALLAHPYFARSGPRSSGKEAFNLAWLDEQLQAHRGLAAVDVQATLAELTAVSIARTIAASTPAVAELYVCGGGAHNTHLLARLAQQLNGVRVATTEALGTDPDWVEAMTFAWLAQRTLAGMAGNAPAVTGAAGER
ncbi:MAG: anhydro-N-acetylmuramic acid kinase, partial [Halioglobus sp.]|nr:anhydro-N-acetylmuramic acid kinase [Halioglobus sp.]